ncbi:MAG: tetratricopeptide repeat protein [Bacteroidota bacterium]
MLNCSACGEFIDNDAKYCPACGFATCGVEVSAKNSKKVFDERPNRDFDSRRIIPRQKKSNEAKREYSKKINAVSGSSKSLSTTKLLYFVLFLFLTAALIIYSSGIFETSTPDISSQQPGFNNSQRGVDLNSLEQINSLEEIVKKNPKDYDSLIRLAHLLNDSGLKERAIEKYKLYLTKFPKDTNVLVDMGVCYFETGKNEEAISAMEKALRINPKHQIANLNLGIVNLSSGNILKAVGYWKRAIEIDSTNEVGLRAKELLKSH